MVEIETSDEETGNSRVELEDREQSPDFQRYATSVSGMLKINFRIHLCDWDEVQNKSDIKGKIWEGMSVMDRYFAPRKNAIENRKCNERCADMLSSSLYGLVNQSALLSNVSEQQIYDMWNGYKHDIRMDLLKNIYLRHNSYKIKDGEINSINAYHTTWMLPAYMARGASAMKAFTEQVYSVFNSQSRMGYPMGPVQPQSFGDKLKAMLPVKK